MFSFCSLPVTQTLFFARQDFLPYVTRQRGSAHFKGGDIRDTNILNLPRNVLSLQVLGRCFAFYNLRDQLVAQQKQLLRVEELQRADWWTCLVWIQDKLRVYEKLRNNVKICC